MCVKNSYCRQACLKTFTHRIISKKKTTCINNIEFMICLYYSKFYVTLKYSAWFAEAFMLSLSSNNISLSGSIRHQFIGCRNSLLLLCSCIHLYSFLGRNYIIHQKEA